MYRSESPTPLHVGGPAYDFSFFILVLEFLQVPPSSLSLPVYSISALEKQCKIQSGQISSTSFRLLLTSHTSLKALIHALTQDRDWKHLPWSQDAANMRFFVSDQDPRPGSGAADAQKFPSPVWRCIPLHQGADCFIKG